MKDSILQDPTLAVCPKCEHILHHKGVGGAPLAATEFIEVQCDCPDERIVARSIIANMNAHTDMDTYFKVLNMVLNFMNELMDAMRSA